MAIQDDYIRKNPFDFQLSDVLEDTTEPKIALTTEQEMDLLSFMESDNTYCKYYDDVVILLEIGLLISELCGLTLELDMKNKAIMVDHQLLSDTKIGYYVEVPKTTQGKREIPMTEKELINHLNVSWNGVRTLKQNQSLLMFIKTSYSLNVMGYQSKQPIIKAC
ncbi:integrase Tn916-like, CTn1-Orf1 [Clostridioides difficile]|nr:integrase Tn916-like, CTn1-Orf1 [Clostridioides difficile]